MGQTLENGLYLPSEGERNCYDGLASNWTTLDAVVGGYRAHVANENIHITSAERSKWNTGVTQAYVLRYASVSLTALGTVAFSALDNTDNVKIGDKVLDSEGKLFALTAVDTANSTATLSALLIDLSKDSDLSNYYTKTETDNLLISKANDSGVMHLTGNETVNGDKAFTGLFTTTGNLWSAVSNTTDDITYLGYRTVHIEQKTSGTLTDLSSGAWNIAELGNAAFFFRNNSGTDIRYKHFLTNTVNRIPVVSGANRFINDVTPNQDNTYDLGNSSLRWRTINDVNPGALSMPKLSAGVDISGYFTTGTTENTYTPTVNGWVSLHAVSTTNSAVYVENSKGFYDSASSVVAFTGNDRYVNLCFPVIGGESYNIVLKSVNTSIAVKFYPCQGNV